MTGFPQLRAWTKLRVEHEEVNSRFMKEYRLLAWPELPETCQTTAHRRILNEMSNRYRSVQHLVRVSGSRPHEVHEILQFLDGKGLLMERELFGLESEGNKRPYTALRGWARRQIGRLLGQPRNRV